MEESRPLEPSQYPASYRIHRIPRDVIARVSAHPLLHGLHPLSAGYFPEASGHQMSREQIDEYILIYCVAGRGWYRTAEGQWPVEKGELLFVLRGSAHRYWADPAEPWTIHWAHLAGSRVIPFLELLGVTTSAPILAIGERVTIVSHFNRVLQLLMAGYSLHHLIGAAAALRAILSEVALYSRYSPPPANRDVNVEQTIQFMLDHLEERLTLDELAAQACLSRSHFSRRFHEKTGYAPIDYFIRLKIQRACELLEATPLEVGEIAARLGYGDQYYFSRIFKKIMGSAPTLYRSSRTG